MTIMIANLVSGVEAVKRVREGQELQCPVCAAAIQTIPKNWALGMSFHGIECPNDRKHYLIHCDDEYVMKEMRARMKARFDKR